MSNRTRTFDTIFDQPRDVQISGLQEQVKDLAAPPTTDEVLDFALSEIAFTIHVIRERIFYDARQRNMAAAATPRKSAAIFTLNPASLEDIV